MAAADLERSSSIAVDTSHGVVLLAHSMRPLTHQDWGQFLEALWEAGRKQGRVRVLVSTPGSAPNANQRLKLTEIAERYSVRIAVCTESRQARAVILTIDWASGIEIQPFDHTAVGDACDYLEIEQDIRDAVVEGFQKIRREMS